MSRMNELSIAIDELRNAAAALNSVADSLTQLFSSEEPAKEEPAPKPITKEKVRQECGGLRSAGTRTAQTIRRGTALRSKPGRLCGSASGSAGHWNRGRGFSPD